ncbi:hypothetical protein SCYAM73S_03331 [Streptomyces cyaneofuscatus]
MRGVRGGPPPDGGTDQRAENAGRAARKISRRAGEVFRASGANPLGGRCEWQCVGQWALEADGMDGYLQERGGTRSVASRVCGALAAGGLAAAGVAALEPGGGRRLQSPRGAADLGHPAVRQHGRVRVRQPEPAGHDDDRRRLDPLRGTGRRAELLPLRGGRPVRPAGGQRRRRGEDLVFRYTFDARDATTKTFLYNTGPVESLDDPDLNVAADVDLELIRLKNLKAVSKHEGRRRGAGGAVERRQGVDAGLRHAAPAGGAQAGGRRPDVRRAGGRPVLPGPARLRPAVRREPHRGRQRRAQGLQRQLDRPPGADRHDHRVARTSRSSASGRRRSAGPPRAGSRRCRGWAIRWSTRSSTR